MKRAEFRMPREEVVELQNMLQHLAMEAEMSGFEPGQIAPIDAFSHGIGQSLKKTDGPHIRVCMTDVQWQRLMFITGELTLDSIFTEEDDSKEAELLEKLSDFLTASGRKLGRSIFGSPENRKRIEDALGEDLEDLA